MRLGLGINLMLKNGGGAAAFSPLDISGLQLWLDASQIVGLNDGDPVGTWNDLSGNANNLTQATGSAKPTYKTAIRSGRPVVRFDGVDDGMAFASTVTLSAYTVFAVLVNQDGVSGSAVLNKVADPYNYNALTPAAVYLQPGGPTIVANYATATAAGEWALIEAYRSGTTLYIGKNATIDGGRASSIDWSVNQLGAPYAGGAAFDLNGDVAEVLIYNVPLSTTDRQAVEAYLNNKWAIY